MKTPTRIFSSLIVATLLATVTAIAQANTPTEAQKGFASIKSLPGVWEGNSPKGRVQVNFKITAGGSAVMSEILGQEKPGQEDMISMIHLDGPNRLLLTHYCATGNQPRMQASTSPNGKIITFTFVDATNLDTPDAGHMQRMVLTLLDENHHTEEWTFLDHGQEHKALFDLYRKM
jgi:hypothetical protein